MTADAGADQRTMEALQAKVKDLSARLVALEVRVDALEVSPMDRAHAGLAKMEASLPLYAARMTQAEVAARKRLTDVE